MNDFRTKLKPKHTKNRISHNENIFLIGSCFAQEIGNKLSDHYFNTFQSPFGIVFNPMSIFYQLRRILSNCSYLEDELVYDSNLYHSMDHHGSFSGIDKVKVLQNINNQLECSRRNLQNADYLIISFGSSYYYGLVRNSKIVSNCHKLPSSIFKKAICDLEILHDLSFITFNGLFKFNPKLKIILTVSPVRYIRDGLIENNLSKARLFLLVEELCSRFEHVEYFPSYELLVDDLRDYRFYGEDMVHPNSQAVNYIWDYFLNTYCEEKTTKIVDKIYQLNTLMSHRSIHNTESSIKQIQAKIEIFKKEILSLDSSIILGINKLNSNYQ